MELTNLILTAATSKQRIYEVMKHTQSENNEGIAVPNYSCKIMMSTIT